MKSKYSSKLGLALAAGGALLSAAAFMTPLIASAATLSSVVSSPTNTGAAITWTTDVPATTQVAYGPTAGVYNASTTLNSSLGTTHTAFIGGLLSNTTYHFAAMSADASSTASTSADMSFTTLNSTASTTASTTISSIVTAPTATGATITWMTSTPGTTQVSYGLNAGNYTASSTLDSGLVTSHSASIINGLLPNTLYHFVVASDDSSDISTTSADMTFLTLMASSTGTTTGTGTGTSTQNLINQINSAWAQLLALLAQLNSATGGSAGATIWGVNGIGTTTGSGGGGTTGIAMIDRQGPISSGGTIDFTGRNFGHEEQVTIMGNGQTFTTAHADGGGNFSTGSLKAPSTPGSYTYLFVGQTSGMSANTTIQVQ